MIVASEKNVDLEMMSGVKTKFGPAIVMKIYKPPNPMPAVMANNKLDVETLLDSPSGRETRNIPIKARIKPMILILSGTPSRNDTVTDRDGSPDDRGRWGNSRGMSEG